MNLQIAILIDRIKSLEAELDVEPAKRPLDFGPETAGSALSRSCYAGIASCGSGCRATC
jgi:hypothetical protein